MVMSGFPFRPKYALAYDVYTGKRAKSCGTGFESRSNGFR